jgi:hypothetical protein
MESGDE